MNKNNEYGFISHKVYLRLKVINNFIADEFRESDDSEMMQVGSETNLKTFYKEVHFKGLFVNE